jgi:acyl-CoA reductase-like NAD-dependent aldehyde dehydrogenase
MSTERVIIDQKVADDFAARLAKRVAALPVGNPLEGEFVIGSVVGKPTIERLQRLVGDAVKQGAKVIAGSDLAPVGGKDTVMKGVVVDHVTPAMALFREESFAPQVSITRVKDADEAVALANDTEYGLSAAVFTRDIARGLAIAKRIDSGICHINGPTVADEAQMPFGGVKGSGFGRFGGRAAIDEFTELRWITIEDPKQSYPF